MIYSLSRRKTSNPEKSKNLPIAIIARIVFDAVDKAQNSKNPVRQQSNNYPHQGAYNQTQMVYTTSPAHGTSYGLKNVNNMAVGESSSPDTRNV